MRGGGGCTSTDRDDSRRRPPRTSVPQNRSTPTALRPVTPGCARNTLARREMRGRFSSQIITRRVHCRVPLVGVSSIAESLVGGRSPTKGPRPVLLLGRNQPTVERDTTGASEPRSGVSPVGRSAVILASGIEECHVASAGAAKRRASGQHHLSVPEGPWTMRRQRRRSAGLPGGGVVTTRHAGTIVEVPDESPLMTPELARVLLRILRRAAIAIPAEHDADAIAS
jgi:hypothetical protein